MAGVRERARAEVMAEIRRLARLQLAENGAAGVSLRAIARDLGMVSSAVYRYVPSRDDLLTMLIIESYEAVGAVAEVADASQDRDDLLGRWTAICLATREWAMAHREDYGLIYGTPVPGYAAPQDTIAAARRFTDVLLRLLVDADAAGCVPIQPSPQVPLAADLSAEVARLVIDAEAPIDPEFMLRGLMAWSQLFGAISHELFGHLHNVIEIPDAYFAHAMRVTGALLGLRDMRQ